MAIERTDSQAVETGPTAPAVPDDCPLQGLYQKRRAQDRDLKILISSWDLETGTGKTTLACRLAAAFDATDQGVTTDKATLSAHELTDAYTREPPGSALIFDEAMGDISNRRSMSSINEAMRATVGMGRVEEKYLIMTCPGIHMVDRDIRAQADVWILTRELGSAAMFRVKFEPFAGHELTHNWGTLDWTGDLPGGLKDVYDHLTREKRARLRGQGDDGQGYVDAQEAQQKTERAVKEARQQKRDEMLREMYENGDLTQKELANSVGLSRSRVADILSNGE
jgi:hypothetical protein